LENWKKIVLSFGIFGIIVLIVAFLDLPALLTNANRIPELPWYPLTYFIPYPNITDEGMLCFTVHYWSHAWICIVIGFIVAGIFTEFISKERITRWLKSGDWRSYVFAAVAGGILGTCSCAILPFFVSLKRKGAGLGPAITFLIASPAVNPVGFLLTMDRLGIGMGLSRIIGAFIMAILVGVIMDLLFKGKGTSEAPMNPQNTLNKPLSPTPTSGTVKRRIREYAIPFKSRLKNAMQYSWDYVKELLWLIILGVFIAGLLNGLIPRTELQDLMSKIGWLGYPLAAFIGIPTFIVSPNEIAIGTVLQGVADPGIILTLLLAGPTVSIVTIYVVRKVIPTKQTFVYVLGVFLLAIGIGLALSPLVTFLVETAGLNLPFWLSVLYHDIVLYGLLTIAIVGAWYFNKKSQKKNKGVT
jgi:uncharacterized membrane protein YraQ (UPF0718 family)